MRTPRFSVVIPVYNQAQFLAETMQSVLRQTIDDFEIVVVNDASPDNVGEVVKQFTDPRIKYIVHEKNKGLPGARNTGMRAARGQYVALLDADDLFHPQKLEVHAAYLEQHPEISVTYNSRFHLNYSDVSIRDLARPPLTVGLHDFIHGYPFYPSDMVIRKSVIETVGYFDERFIAGGEDMEYPSMLTLAGCKFASVDRALNYRRYHSGRYRKNLDARLKDVQDVLAKIYADPRCPEEIRQLGETPLTENYIVVIYLAFIQNRTEDGQRFLHNLVQINPKVLQGHPCQVTEYFTNHSSADENEDHVEILGRLFAQLPALPVNIANQLDSAIQQGYLIKGVRSAVWGRNKAALRYFGKAAELGASFSPRYLQKVSTKLVNYEVEMGSEAAKSAMNRLLPHIRRLSAPAHYRKFQADLSAQHAFENFKQGQFRRVPGNVIRAIFRYPRLLADRGMISIFARSLIKRD